MRRAALTAAACLAAGCAGEVSLATGDGGADGAPPADCYQWLDQHAVSYERGPVMDGVVEPVTVTTPIDGLVHRYLESAEPRATFFMDCQLAMALARAAPILRQHDVIEVVDLGVYNYRCIGGGTPPDCPNGISEHAYAKAIDIAGYTTSDGTTYSVLDDWVIDPDGEDTCAAPTENDKDDFLHRVICAQKADRVWNIVLTPNYNADHRNHFHVDLTADGDFIERTEGPVAPRVDTGPDRH